MNSAYFHRIHFNYYCRYTYLIIILFLIKNTHFVLHKCNEYEKLKIPLKKIIKVSKGAVERISCSDSYAIIWNFQRLRNYTRSDFWFIYFFNPQKVHLLLYYLFFIIIFFHIKYSHMHLKIFLNRKYNFFYRV